MPLKKLLSLKLAWVLMASLWLADGVDVLAAPVILAQPSSQSVVAGTDVTFEVVASGVLPLSFHWKKNGVELSGQANATLVLKSVTTADAGDYVVTVTDSTGATTSAAATLTVTATAQPPQVVVPPASQNVVAGASVTFTVAASGTSPLSYQWKKNGVSLSGQTSASLVLTNVTSADAGDYSAVVSNSAGTAASAAATLTVTATAQPPQIQVPPASQTVTAGADVVLHVVASGTAPLSFQWKKNGVNLAGEISATLLLKNVTSADAGSYTVEVSNSAGASTSVPATVTVTAPSAGGPGSIDTGFVSSGVSNVTALAVQSDGKVIAAFNAQGSGSGSVTNRIERFDVNGTADATFSASAAADQPVLSIAIQSDGKILLGGKFSHVNGTAQNHLARLTADGSIDTSFQGAVGTDGDVATIGVDGQGKIVIGGGFTSAGGSNHPFVARLNSDGSADASFAAPAPSGPVETLAITSDGKILIGGSFHVIGRESLNGVARLNANGTVDATFIAGAGVGANGDVRKIALEADGKVVLAGSFSTFDNKPAASVARLNADGTMDGSFSTGPGPNGPVDSLVVQSNGGVIIAGEFTAVSGATENGLARLDASGNLDSKFSANLSSVGAVHDVALSSQGQLVVGGSLGLSRLTLGDLLGSGSLGIRLQAGQALQLSFQVPVGQTYHLEAADSLSGSAWVQLDSGIGDGTVKSMAAGKATASMRFYRIRP